MNPRVDEIVLLTHEWESMRAWWGTLLGADPRTVGHRIAVVETAGLRVVIEHSDIAMNANPEVAGVISLTVSAPSAIAALDTYKRLDRDRFPPPPRHKRRQRSAPVVPRPQWHRRGNPLTDRRRCEQPAWPGDRSRSHRHPAASGRRIHQTRMRVSERGTRQGRIGLRIAPSE